MPLPAPYAPPWKRLGEDLVATLAWLRLKLRELARRNGEGKLSVPGFWPRRWPQLFWPLVLAASVMAPAALVVGLSQPPLEVVPGTPLETSAEAKKEADGPDVSIPLEWPAPAEPMAYPEAPEDKAPEERDGHGGGEPEPEPEADGLLAEWSEGDQVGLLEAIRADPDDATLTLQASGTFLALSQDNRLAQAERWRARATDWGYSHLEVVDGEGRLLGREARVGEGMILLVPADAGGSPAANGEVGDGRFGNRSGGTGGPLGSAPDARPRRWAGLLGRPRRGTEPAAHGGMHRQPPAAAG